MKHDAPAIRILLVDDHPAIRKGLHILLAGRGHQVRAEAKNRAEVLEILETQAIDIALLDLTLQEGSGLELLPELEERGISVLVYTMHEDSGIIRQALRYGALGYVSKQEDTDILLEAIEAVAGGKRYLSPCAAQSAAQGESGGKRPEDSLSDRERQIFVLMGKGCGNTEIAEQLQLSRRTVETYCTRMAKKMDFPSRRELRKYAVSAT